MTASSGRRILAAVSGLAMAAAMMTATAQAEPTRINIDISQTFKWDSRSIKEVAVSTKRVMEQRCKDGCTVLLRIYVTEATRKSLVTRVDWLRSAILEEVRDFNFKTVEIVDTLVMN